MKKILLASIPILTYNICIAQITSGVVDNEASYQLVNNATINVIRIVKNGDAGVIGSHYLNEEFQSGTIIYHNSKQKIFLPLRYNAYTKEIEAKRKNDIVAVSPVEGMEVLLGDKSFVQVLSPQLGKKVFAESLVQGKKSLFNIYDIKVNKAPNDATLLNIENKDEIKIKDSFWFNTDASSPKQVPSRKKELSKLFGADDIAYAKKAGLNLKRKEDLIQFFTYLNGQ